MGNHKNSVDYLEKVFLKDGIELPEKQWLGEIRANYFADYGCFLTEEDIFELDEEYVSKSGHVYETKIYYACPTAGEVIDCIIDDGERNVIINLLEAVKRLPNDILHNMLVATELKWPSVTRKIEYKNGKYMF